MRPGLSFRKAQGRPGPPGQIPGHPGQGQLQKGPRTPCGKDTLRAGEAGLGAICGAPRAERSTWGGRGTPGTLPSPRKSPCETFPTVLAPAPSVQAVILSCPCGRNEVGQHSSSRANHMPWSVFSVGACFTFSCGPVGLGWGLRAAISRTLPGVLEAGGHLTPSLLHSPWGPSSWPATQGRSQHAPPTAGHLLEGRLPTAPGRALPHDPSLSPGPPTMAPWMLVRGLRASSPTCSRPWTPRVPPPTSTHVQGAGPPFQHHTDDRDLDGHT